MVRVTMHLPDGDAPLSGQFETPGEGLRCLAGMFDKTTVPTPKNLNIIVNITGEALEVG